MSLGVTMSSEYLLRWYHSRYLLKTPVRRTHGVQLIADPYLLNGVPNSITQLIQSPFRAHYRTR
jgi:hypothetical protein